MSVQETKLILENWNNFLEEANKEEQESELLTEGFFDDWDAWDYIGNALMFVPVAGLIGKAALGARGLYRAAKWGNTIAKAAKAGAQSSKLGRVASASQKAKSIITGGKKAAEAAGGLGKLRKVTAADSGAAALLAKRQITNQGKKLLDPSYLKTFQTEGARKIAEIAAKYPKLAETLRKTEKFVNWAGYGYGAVELGKQFLIPGEAEAAQEEAIILGSELNDDFSGIVKKLENPNITEAEADSIIEAFNAKIDDKTNKLKAKAQSTEKQAVQGVGRRIKGVNILQKEGYEPGLDPMDYWKKIYDLFYADLQENNLLDKLGTDGMDYIFGPNHQKALDALKKATHIGTEKDRSKKPKANDLDKYKIAGTDAPVTSKASSKKDKQVKMVKMYTYASPGQAAEAASRGELDPAYQNRPEVLAALEKYLQS